MSRERSFVWSNPNLTADAARGMAELDMMRGLRDETVPSEPIGALIGMAITEVEEGRIVMRLTPTEYHYNSIGSVHGDAA